MSAARVPVRVDGRALSLSNLDKVLFPRDGYTKGDLIEYYRSVAASMLPHVRNRPLTLERFPNGIDEASFFEKHVPKAPPEWLETVTLTSPEGRRANTTYMLCNDEPALVYIANLAAIVLHVWTSRVETIEEPEYVFFDLDPGERCTIKTLASVALAVRSTLEEIGLETLVKTSGGMGLHLVVPLEAGYTYDHVKAFAELIAHRVADHQDERVSLQRTLSKRPDDAVYLDYLQVGRGKTMVAPYSARARDGAPVSTPLHWSEVEAYARKRTGKPSEVFTHFTIRLVPKRLASEGDLWGPDAWKPQGLETALARARRSWS